MFNYEHEDETPQNPKDKFKVNVVLDQAQNSIEERYEQLKTFNDYFGFLYRLNKLKEFTKDDLLKHCKDLELLLTDENEKDINYIELFDELQILTTFAEIENFNTPIDTLSFVYANNVNAIFSNLCICLRILFTIPYLWPLVRDRSQN